MDDLRVSILQTQLHWEDPAANRRALTPKVLALSGQTDLIVLPEMFTTGFSMRAAELAEPTGGPTLAWMREQAHQTQAVLTGSFMTRDQDRHFNRLHWVEPNGRVRTYDKRHLFTLAGEENYYAPGKDALLVDYKGWRIFPLICYDLRFPVWSRNRFDYDLLIYVANWPEKRAHHWRSLLVARAIENQVYTVGVNRVGEDGNGFNHAGDSTLIDYSGRHLWQAAHLETTATFTLSHSAMQQFRARYNFLADRDLFHLD